jgi:hypothetical protein
MKIFTFYWMDGTKDSGEGSDVRDAFIRLGFSAGAVRALDYFKEETQENATANN